MGIKGFVGWEAFPWLEWLRERHRGEQRVGPGAAEGWGGHRGKELCHLAGSGTRGAPTGDSPPDRRDWISPCGFTGTIREQ